MCGTAGRLPRAGSDGRNSQYGKQGWRCMCSAAACLSARRALPGAPAAAAAEGEDAADLLEATLQDEADLPAPLPPALDELA